MPVPQFAIQMLPEIENEMRQIVDLVNYPAMSGEKVHSKNGIWQFLHHMLSYHLGWTESNLDASGKRIRPLIVLLVTSSAGSNWLKALPAAAAVELLHNFSLIHDDIEDNSPVRRGRPTVWVNWGVPQAINTGDVMFTLSHLALMRLKNTTPLEVTLNAAIIFHNTCLALTQGQFLDMSYENERSLPLEAYWPMINGKTASLIAACTELGALIAEVPEDKRLAYQRFGNQLGLAFQIQDDMLGIWGNIKKTGKSSDSDLVSGKKSLPVLYGLSQRGIFAERWLEGSILIDEVDQLADQLKAEGAYDYSKTTSEKLTEEALDSLEAAKPVGDAGAALHELAKSLLSREV